MPKRLSINGREYGYPGCPTVVLCLDGLDARYIDAAVDDGMAPFLGTLRLRGFAHTADSAMPSFTNPNNISIVTGAPPSVHGIAGNYFLDPDTGDEIMMNDPKFLRAETILAAFGQAGAKVAVITAKDKLRRLLGAGLPIAGGRCICFSAERAGDVSQGENGLDSTRALIDFAIPSVYSSEVSEAVLAAGVALIQLDRPDIIYLSTTDYIQHLYAPHEAEAKSFVAMIDKYLRALDAAGAAFVATADHGMNAKTTSDGQPICLYLESFLAEQIPEARARAILPITDPYVLHHGALGSFALLYLGDASHASRVAKLLSVQPEVNDVLGSARASRELELPLDRIGDLCVLATGNAVLGSSREKHDLSGLHRPLRSHGGLHEQKVPFIINRPLIEDYSLGRLRNFDAFHVALGGLAISQDG